MKRNVTVATLQNLEFERRVTAEWALHLTMLIPLIVYLIFSYLEEGGLSLWALTWSACSALFLLAVVYGVTRARVLGSMRRERIIGEDYQAPE